MKPSATSFHLQGVGAVSCWHWCDTHTVCSILFVRLIIEVSVFSASLGQPFSEMGSTIWKHPFPQDWCAWELPLKSIGALCTDWTHTEQSWWESSFPRMASAESSRSFIIFIWQRRPFICSLFSNRYTINGGIILPSGNHFINKGHTEPPSPLIARWSVYPSKWRQPQWMWYFLLQNCWLYYFSAGKRWKKILLIRFALHYVIFFVNSEPIKTKLVTLRLSVQ